ncbi:MAG: hypothetical protein E7462_02265 [Ruminococcaceae bacterium]|nr:hypothetical protein [Oscillospiraceae bacterium]
MLDFNCYVGAWPFHPLAVETFGQLQQLHKENGIEGGFVSSIKSIFYRDYFYSEEELHEQLKGSAYRHVLTVNPQLPACMDIVNYALENWNIAGVRILPSYHGYNLNEPALEPLCAALEKAGLPLFLTVNLEDVRNTYLLIPKPLPMEQIALWLEKHHGLTVVLCGPSPYDVVQIEESILCHPAAFYDPSGMRLGSFPFDNHSDELRTRLLYGSMSGILCLKSSLLHFEKKELTPEQTKRSLYGTDFFAKCPGLTKK